MENKIKEGDTVFLRSNNRVNADDKTTMTVSLVGSFILCHWFYAGELREGRFSEAELQVYGTNPQ